MNNTLVLSAGFEPLRVVSWQRAFTLIFQGKVEILETYTQTVRTVSQSYQVPAVVKLTRFIQFKRTVSHIRFSRANLYARDEFSCQYCYKRFPDKELTLDHIIPVVKGGRKTWENIVTACKKCNQKKGDRSVEQMGFKLFKKPKAPQWLPGVIGNVQTKAPPEVWGPYLVNVYEK